MGWDPTKDRYTVEIAGGRQIMQLQTNNVVVPVDTMVKVFGLEGAQQYNGKWGRVTKVIPESESDISPGGKYQVCLQGGKNIQLKIQNCRAQG